MKKILTIIAMVMAATIAYAQSFEFTDIQVNTETEVHIASPMEPLPHTFVNVGNTFNFLGGGSVVNPNIMAGWYKIHGIFANFSWSIPTDKPENNKRIQTLNPEKWRDLKSEEYEEGEFGMGKTVLFTVGYIYNVPVSRITGSDFNNVIQLYAGLGYGSAKYYIKGDYGNYYTNENTSGLAFDTGMLVRGNHFNFRYGFQAIAGGGGYFGILLGFGYTF